MTNEMMRMAKKETRMICVVGIFVALFFRVASTASNSSSMAVFIFGDSLVDSGNNNYLVTDARADFTPYGLDTPSRHATGRFSNAMNIADLTCESLGVEPVLPYLDPHIAEPSNLLRGANFASAGVGILDDTGIQFGHIIRMPSQLKLFKDYQDKVAAIIGRSATNQLVANAVISVTLGGNDYVNNYYYLPVNARTVQFPNVDDYNNYIISEYKTKILQRLYELGGRRIVVAAVGPLGCVPAQLALRSLKGECVPNLQRVSVLFNAACRRIVDELNSQYGGIFFTFADTYNLTLSFINNPQAYGFVTSKYSCCGQGRFNAILTCTAVSPVCPDRNIFVWWDEYHPTERAARIIVDGSSSVMYPVNLHTLLNLNH